jgi:hypothetical protein
MKIKYIILLIVIGFTGFMLPSCVKSSVEVLSGSCDTVNMKYKTDILPIISDACYRCHGNGNTVFGDGVNLEGYINLSAWANIGGKLEGNITHAKGFIAMPYDQPKLPDCEVNKIVDWINRGAKND